MSRIVLSTIGSLGDLHPMIALGLELRARGHEVVINTWRGYEEKIRGLGLQFANLRPEADISNKELHRKAMDARTGPEFIIKELIMGSIRDSFVDMMEAVKDADLFVTGEIVYAARSVHELTGKPWISTSLAPVSFFSAHDPSVYMSNPVFEWLRSLPPFVHEGMLSLMRRVARDWTPEYRRMREELGVPANDDVVFQDKFSPLRHLALFSKVLGTPQPDWPSNTLQTGFCFFDESTAKEPLEPALDDFISAGEPPIVFTLGSAASLDPGEFFNESVKAAKQMGCRAVMIYGREMEPPAGMTDRIFATDYAPYSLVFPRAAVVVHQGGVGTTAQVLRAGVPHLIDPFSHDQPDNASRCKRIGVAEVISRGSYTAARVVQRLKKILTHDSYKRRAAEKKGVVDSEPGTSAACDAIEHALSR